MAAFGTFERMMATRYLRARRQEGFISVIAWFSLIGIALGVATLIIVMSVMNGFRHELITRIVGFNGHVTIYSQAGPVPDYEEVTKSVAGIAGVVSAAPIIDGQVMATANGIASGALVRGVRLEDIVSRKTFDGKLRGGTLEVFEEDEVVVGYRLAQKLRLATGDKITLVMMDATAKTTSFLDKQVDAVLGGITEFPTLFKAKGVDSTVLAFADYGVNTIGMTVIAHNDTIKAKPDLVKRFVRASQKSYEAMIAEPKEAAASVNRMNKDLPMDTLIKTVEESNLVSAAGIPKGKRIGLAEDSDWQLTLDLMKKYREVETNLPATAFYTNEFLSN